jgi:hypothetical protein
VGLIITPMMMFTGTIIETVTVGMIGTDIIIEAVGIMTTDMLTAIGGMVDETIAMVHIEGIDMEEDKEVEATLMVEGIVEDRMVAEVMEVAIKEKGSISLKFRPSRRN